MEKPDFVIDLVRSLSKPEKRYFKLFAARYKQDGEKKYLQLFRAFEKMRTNDPVELAGKLKEDEYSGTLAGDKHYLSEMLVGSLRHFHAESTVQARLANEMLAVELLRRKGLFAHALRRLLRLKKEAACCELAETVVQAIGLECGIRAAATIEWPELSQQLAAEKEDWLFKMIHLNRIDQMRIEQLRFSIEKGRPQTSQERAAWKQRLGLFNPEESLTGLVTEKSIRLRAHSHAYFVMQDIAAADGINAQQHELFRAHPWQIERSPADYLAFLFRYISTSIQVKNFPRAGWLLEEVRAIRREHNDNPYSEVAAFIDERLLSTELFFFGKSGQYDKMRAKAADAEQFFRTTHARQQSVIGFNMAIAFMFSGDYRKVLHWTHRSLTNAECKKDYMLFLAGNLHQLVAHIELKDFDAAISRVNTAKRFVSQRKENGCSDSELVALLGKCASTDDLAERADLACKFLARHENDPGFMRTDEYVAIRAWLANLAGQKMQSLSA